MLTILSRVQRKPFSLRQREEMTSISSSGCGCRFVLFTGGPILASFLSASPLTGDVTIVVQKNYQTLIRTNFLTPSTIRSTIHLAPSLWHRRLVCSILLNQICPAPPSCVIYYMPSIASGVVVSIFVDLPLQSSVWAGKYLLSLVGIQRALVGKPAMGALC
jgi:hypothetical protein